MTGKQDQHLTEEQIFQNLSSPENSAPTSLDVSRETSPHPHLVDEDGNDPSDRLGALGARQQVPVTADGHIVKSENQDGQGGGTCKRRHVSDSGQDDGSEVMEDKQSEGARDNAEKPPSRPQSRSAMRGGAGQRPQDLNVRWPSQLKAGLASQDSQTPDPEVRRAAKRMVRRHTGRPTVPPPDSSDEDQSASGSAISLTSTTEPNLPPKRRQKPRQSSGQESGYSTDGWSTGGEQDEPVRGRGVLSELLSLYRQDRRDRDHGVVKSLLSTSDEYQRRRWSEKSLFDTGGDDSRRGSMNSVTSGMSASENESEWYSDTTRVRHNRRKQHMPHRSQDLNEPYIPNPKSSHPISPSTNVTIMQRLHDFFGRHGGPSTWFGSPATTPEQPRQGGEGEYRNIVALVITASSLAGVASPALSRLAPASGRDAETSSGQRKMSYYENVNETRAQMREEEEDDDTRNGADSGDMSNLQRVMEEGRARGKQKGGRRRGKRKQREMAVTKHIASVIQRKL